MSTPPIVIIAEPDPMISSVLRVEFSHADFAVFLAATGAEVEEYAAHTVAHLIVIDAGLKMPAFEACVHIRRRPGYETRPIVLTASDPSPKIRTAAEKAGATLVLAKPYSVSDLFSALRPFVPPDDLLLTHHAHAPGMSAPQKEWKAVPKLTVNASDDSALSRNGLLLPIVRRKGVLVPVVASKGVSIPLFRAGKVS